MLETQQILQNRYCLQEQLSPNPTRQTWLAEDRETQQKVIVKLLPFSAQTQWQNLKLFEREAQTLKHLDLAEIPSYLDYFSVDKETGGGLPWFALVQEYVAGSSLQQLLKRGEKFNESGAKRIAEQLLKILIYLHELSPPVLHRDIKPSNIIRDEDGKIHLVDFGAVQDKAKVEGATFTVVGTGGYAPPEQLWGRAVAASDLYALGATLIHVLTGIAPGELPQQGMRLQFRDKVDVSPGFADWLEKLIAPAVERRYSSAREALAALQEIREEAAVRVRYGRLGGLALLQYGAIALSILALPGLVYYRKQGHTYVARQNLGTINRAQRVYFLENDKFADSLEKLELGIQKETEHYRYEIVETPLFAINYAIPKQALKKNEAEGYVGVVAFNHYSKNNEPITSSLFCQDDREEAFYLREEVRDRPMIEDNHIRCPVGRVLSEPSEPKEIEIGGKPLQLAYRAWELAVSAPDDESFLKIFKIVENIDDPKVKVRAFEAIAPYFNSTQQLETAMQRVETIANREAKARILLVLARKFEQRKDDERAGQLRTRVFDLGQSIASHLDENDKLWLLKKSFNGLNTPERVERAVEIARSLQDKNKVAVVRAIAPRLKTEEQHDQAWQIVDTIESDYWRKRGQKVLERENTN